MKKNLYRNLFICSTIIFLLLFTKGGHEFPKTYQDEHSTQLTKPFDLSISSARYALTESIVKNHSVFLSTNQAKFGAPDVADQNGHFISIFTPGVAILGIPLYMLGLSVHLPQLFTFFTINIFAIMNLFLIAQIAQKLGVKKKTSFLAGFIFLFATDALPYAHTFTQHHISVTLLLVLLNNSLSQRTRINSIFAGLLYGIGILIDIPNAIILFPVLAYIIAKTIGLDQKNSQREKVKDITCLIIGILLMISCFCLYNFKTTGNPLTPAQNIGRTKFFRHTLSIQNNPDNPGISDSEPNANTYLFNLPFSGAAPINGLYILLISNQRSWIFFSPIILIGIAGLWIAIKQKRNRSITLISIVTIGLNIILYSFFDDPWGGWAYGPRYLIPSAAILAYMLALVIEKYQKKKIFIVIVSILFIYSIYVNVLGALTTTAIPPKNQADTLTPRLSYTYQFNQKLITNNISGNLLYNMFFNNFFSEQTYLIILTILLSSTGIILIIPSKYSNSPKIMT